MRGSSLTGNGPYRVVVRLRYQAVPVNLVAAIQSVGFDYGMSPRQVADAVIAGGEVIWHRYSELAPPTDRSSHRC